MKITHFHVAVRLEHGGVVRAVLDLCGALARRGHEVTLVTTDDHDVPPEWRSGDAGTPEVVTVPAPALPGRLFAPRGRRALAAAMADADIAHLHGVWGPYNTQAATALRRAGVPYVLSVHGMLDDWCMAQGWLKKRLYNLLFERRTLAGAARVHCTAQAEAAQAAKWFPPQRASIIPLVFDLGPFRALPGPDLARRAHPALAGDGPHLLFLSRLHRKKGVELLLRAAARLREAHPTLVVAVAGSGDETYARHLTSLAGELELTSTVRFLGHVDGPEKISLYQAADVFVLPTSQENFGFVLFEALAAGTPLVTTRGADTWPELEASGGAIIADPTPGAIASAVEQLLADDTARRERAAAGRAWVLEHLGDERIVSAYEEMYEAGREGRRD